MRAYQADSETEPNYLQRFFKRITDYWPVSLLTLILLVAGIFDLVAKPFEAPSIDVTDSDPLSPFNFPFSVRNKSFLFAMTDLTWVCEVVRMRSGNMTMTNSGMIITYQGENIPASKLKNFKCRIAPDGMPISELSMYVEMNYSTLFPLWHRSERKYYYWKLDGFKSRWLEGTGEN